MRTEAEWVTEAGPEGLNQCQAQDQKKWRMVLNREVAVQDPSGLCGDVTGYHGGGWVAIQEKERRPGQRRHLSTALEPGGTERHPLNMKGGEEEGGWVC